MNPYLIIAALVAVLAAGAGGFKLGADHEIAAQAREQNHIAEAVDAANTASAQAIAGIKVINKTIQNEVQREVQNNIVYRDCKHSPDGLRLLNEALTGSKPTGDSKLPKADPPGR
jgi:uncharacterized protein HemX